MRERLIRSAKLRTAREQGEQDDRGEPVRHGRAILLR
jgi:hypothetical protein